MAKKKAKTNNLGDQMPTPVPDGGGYPRYPVERLRLDIANPRLVEYFGGRTASQFDLVKILYQHMAVEELAMSIAYNGYFEHEPLIAEKQTDGTLVVIEGNRRLAAVRLLLDKSLREKLNATDLPRTTAARRREIATLPVVITTREQTWRYLGFKHVNGPATWGAYAKAQYIAQVHNDYRVPLDDIAQQIGDYSNTVERQYRGLMVVHQAEKLGVFNRDDIAKSKFHFNYIYTALDNGNCREFLGLDQKRRDAPRPVPAAKHKNLEFLLKWLYGCRSENAESLIRSQNPDLGILCDSLGNPASVKALKSGSPLLVARDIGLGDEHLFRSALLNARGALQRAMGTLSTGYDSSDTQLMNYARDVEQLAGDLVEGMTARRHKRTRTRTKKK